jgi:hypothetical protein
VALQGAADEGARSADGLVEDFVLPSPGRFIGLAIGHQVKDHSGLIRSVQGRLKLFRYH